MDAITSKLKETLDFIRKRDYAPELYKELNCQNEDDLYMVDDIIDRLDSALTSLLIINRRAMYYFGQCKLKEKS